MAPTGRACFVALLAMAASAQATPGPSRPAGLDWQGPARSGFRLPGEALAAVDDWS